MKYRSIQHGVIAISIISIVILLMALFYFYKVQQQQNGTFNDITTQQRATMINNVLMLKNAQEESPVFDNSAWDELQEAITNNDTEWLDVNIGYMSERYNAATTAVFNDQNKLCYDNKAEIYKNIDFYADLKLPSLFRNNYKQDFYLVKNNKLFAYYIYEIVSSYDILTRKEEGTGYLMLVKEYNDSLITEFSKSLGSVKMQVALNQAILDKAKQENIDKFFYSYELKNQYGNPVAYLYFTAENEIENLFHGFLPILFVVFGIVILMFLAMSLYTQIVVVKPLHTIADVFYTNDIGKLDSMKKSDTEFGVLSNTIATFFNQKNSMEKLNKEMEERNKELTNQYEKLANQQHEIEAKNDSIEVLNEQIMERNKANATMSTQLEIQNKLIEDQNKIIKDLQTSLEDQSYQMRYSNKQIMIANSTLKNNQNYTTRLRNVLQVAVTPTKHVFHDYFLYTKPKDKIGGDFWFAKKIDNWVIAGIGDCNMSGISGAVLSAIDIYLLSDILNMRRSSELRPDLVLNDLNLKIQNTMGEEYETDIDRDGLHLSMFMYNTESLEGYFAAAKRTMVVMRRGEPTEYFGDNLSLGKIHDDKKFNNIKIKLAPDDIIYMYSDGCTDVVGGPFCKKLLAVNFKKEIANKQIFTLVEQKVMFKDFFETWIGDLEQTDDITLLGFKI